MQNIISWYIRYVIRLLFLFLVLYFFDLCQPLMIEFMYDAASVYLCHGAAVRNKRNYV